MSVKGLLEAEKAARALQKKLDKSFNSQLKELKEEIKKVEFLLGDKTASRTWANSQVDSARRQKLMSMLNETERLYLEAGNSRAARIFKTRMEKQLRGTLTNLKANELEVQLRVAASRAANEPQILTSLSNVKTESALRELYSQSRSAGGFISGTGRGFMRDLVTLETKAAGSKTIGKYMSDLFNQYEARLKDVFVKGIVRGDSYKQMVDNLVSTTGITKRKAGLLVRTEANAIFNESVREVIDKNPLVKGYRFRAVLDSKTSKICQEHDGRYIRKEDVKPGVNFPPLHPNCRSTVTTVLANENERKDTVQRYTKNKSNQWEKVPPGMTYLEYKDKFGFSNSKNPKTFNANTRSIHDTTLARVQTPKYQGYVKPSASSTKRIQDMVEAFINNDTAKLDAIKQNTGQESIGKALQRQAQAESGFDGLPLQLNSLEFEKQVQKNGYTRVYRQFRRPEHIEQFVKGGQFYGTGHYNYGAGTYTFTERPVGTDYGKHTVEIALKSEPSKILDLSGVSDSQMAIAMAATPDIRINEVLGRVADPTKRREIFSILATEYGYDAIKVSNQSRGNYIVILNRTAAIVKGD